MEKRRKTLKINIGAYEKDGRLAVHDETYATFHGEGCGVAVTVVKLESGQFLAQKTTEDGPGGEVNHELTDKYDTAAEAIASMIGAVRA